MAAVRRRLLISGRVQGVFFRAGAQRHAERAGLVGWARNLGDGRVEVVMEGEPDAVEALERWCHRGPPAASVAGVEATEEPPEGLASFVIR